MVIKLSKLPPRYRLADWLRFRQKTIKQVATYMGCHEETIRRWIRGRGYPTYEDFVKLCRYLGIQENEIELGPDEAGVRRDDIELGPPRGE